MRNKSRSRPSGQWRNALACSGFTLLAACGGGGSGDDAGTGTSALISVGPVAGATVVGGRVTFTVSVSTRGPQVSYQWQVSVDDGASWSDIVGATAFEYVIAAVNASLAGKLYRVSVNADGVSQTSEPASLTVTCSALAARLDGRAYYDACLDVTWLADANLAATLPLGVTGIETDGSMHWPAAKAWVQALNARSYLGRSDWRLPVVRPQNGESFQLTGTDLQGRTGQLDLGFNIGAPHTRYAGSMASELPFLLYSELGGRADYSSNGTPRAAFVNGTGPFKGLSHEHLYWTGTAYGADGAFAFSFAHGNQNAFVADAAGWRFNVLALRDGDIAAAP